MVFVFLSTSVDPPAFIFMGEHQDENELLITGGYPDDVWFHVDSMSSAHVYLRLPRGMSQIPEELLEDCCQLVKKNSMKGAKLEKVRVVYTERANLRKTKGMDVGQVGFVDAKNLKFRETEKKNSHQTLRRLEKTRLREPIGG